MGMTFRELIDYAKKEEASDVHVTVGTNIALRRSPVWKPGDHGAGTIGRGSDGTYLQRT